ncbi:hypothetical protein FXO38_13321 [Capsicum annuum]|nr:hypothetical protein FXO38_13321 [Capsicum annuum]
MKSMWVENLVLLFIKSLVKHVRNQNLGFEKVAQTQKSTDFGEEFGAALTSVGEEVGGVSAGVGKELCDEDSTGAGEKVGAASTGYGDLFDKIDDEYGSDVHEEVRTLRKGKRAAKLKRKKRCPRAEGVKLVKKGVDIGYDEYSSKKKNTLKDKIGGDEPYFDSDEEASFEIDNDVDADVEDEVQQASVVEVENNFILRWFIRLVKDDLELGDETELTTISDIQKSLDTAIHKLLPNAEQRMCARHILANWSKQWKGIERRNYFWRCAKFTYEQELRKNLGHMEMLGDKIVDGLLWYNIER